MLLKLFLLLQLALFRSVSSFVFPSARQNQQYATSVKHGLCMAVADEGMDRRSMIFVGGAWFAGSLLLPSNSFAADKGKVVVMGGAGYIGSRVTASLYEKGFDVVSASRSSPSEQAAKVKANVGKDIPATYVSVDATKDDLATIMKGASAVVSCVGIPPWEKSGARAGNGLANVRIAEAAKAAGVNKYVYVSVAKDVSSGPGTLLFGEYFTGKKEAEAAANKNFGSSAVFIKPGFVDGVPPGEIRPPPPPGLPAISPDVVAQAAVNGVLGQVTGSADGYDAILAAAKP